MARLWCSAGAWFIYAKICKQMSKLLNPRSFLIGGFILACAFCSQAMSLGRTKGTAWVGRPLDIGVQIKLDSGEDAASMCFAVDVLYGDSRVNSGQVRTFIEPGASREEATLRIQAAAPVDEPVVTLYLKAGCSQAVTRRFVILSDVFPDNRGELSGGAFRGGASTASNERIPADFSATGIKSTDSGTPPAPALRSGRPFKNPRQGGLGDAITSGPAMEKPTAAQAPPVRSVVRKPAPEKLAPRSRLKLDPADLLIERDPVLRASAELLSEPQDTGTRRAEAAALWRAINASPEEILKDAQRLQALQSDVSTLQGQKRKDEAEIVALKSRLQTVEAERVGREWVFGLAMALAAALGAAAFFWRRSRVDSNRQWWNPKDGAGANADQSAAAPVPPEVANAASTPEPGAGSALDIDLDAGPTSTPVAKPALVTRSALAPLDGVDFQSSLSGAGRAVKVDELLDVQQQADFFISLGQYEQAVETLRNHIADNVETSALAYLDLLKIYHLQGREKDFSLVRTEFNGLFNSEVPEFAAFDQQTRGLQSYPSALSRIVELWPTPMVLDVIEESILRKPGQGSQVFDLEAYRELLMLYAVAKDIVDDHRQGRALKAPALPTVPSAERGGAARIEADDRRPDFQSTNIQPLPVSAPVSAGAMDSRGMPLMRVPPSPNLGLDIDLSVLVPASPPAAPPTDPVAEAPGGTPEAKARDSRDSHLIDFDLFDLATKAHGDSKRGKS